MMAILTNVDVAFLNYPIYKDCKMGFTIFCKTDQTIFHTLKINLECVKMSFSLCASFLELFSKTMCLYFILRINNSAAGSHCTKMEMRTST